MLTYNLGGKNKYYSLYSHIRDDILCGNLKGGQKLPSKRALALNLSVSVITVQTAYEQLLAEGYIVSKERSGYFVADVNGCIRAPSPTAQEEPVKARCQFDLVSGLPPAELFPFSVWAKLMRSVLSDEGEHLLERVPSRGDLSLRREIAACLYRMRGVTVDPARVVIGAGAEYLYGIVVQIVGRDKLFAIENPGYGKIFATYSLHGAKCLPVPVGSCGADPVAVERSSAHILHISPSHQFPTGAVMPASVRSSLIAWARRQGAYIVEDDYDSEFRLSGKPLQSMLELCPDRVIYINTFSKTLAPSMRMGYMVLPPGLCARYNQLFARSANAVPLFEQKTLAAMIGQGYFERHINRLKNYFRTVRGEVLSAISSLPFPVQINDTGSGLHITATFPAARSDGQIKKYAEERGVDVRCLGDYLFSPAEGYGKTAVVNYGGLKKGVASMIAARLSGVPDR